MLPIQPRKGIAVGGNWTIDRVKRVDRLPGRGMLANIRSESVSTGGSANVLLDLARMGFPHPLATLGVVGDDPDGRLVRDTCAANRIDAAGLAVTSAEPTSYTDVMCETASGDRSFFHRRGANALFGPDHVRPDALSCRIFHLAYLLLLDRLDEPHPEHGTRAAAVLKSLRDAGIRTSLDVVSEESDRFARIVPPALRHADYLVCNEIEIGRITGIAARDPRGRLSGPALQRAAARAHQMGDLQLVAVHAAEGVYLRDRQGGEYARGSRVLPGDFIRGAVGAGDAFCAGLLWGLHEDWGHPNSVELGIACATACLAHESACEGVRSAAECLALAREFPERPPPV